MTALHGLLSGEAGLQWVDLLDRTVLRGRLHGTLNLVGAPQQFWRAWRPYRGQPAPWYPKDWDYGSSAIGFRLGVPGAGPPDPAHTRQTVESGGLPSPVHASGGLAGWQVGSVAEARQAVTLAPI